ncbi:hypothetical protein, partial [Arcanobacterium phocae]|uniref:hypothetical protein n=1 Tax=Arcanobacterium phocae TaxID=131112 RepID=UPI001C0EEF89
VRVPSSARFGPVVNYPAGSIFYAGCAGGWPQWLAAVAGRGNRVAHRLDSPPRTKSRNPIR